ncbi:MAG: succinate dehydrogenase, cytochrome b556 subunit [Anaerolineales bacterium]|nr:succinate dehydrogenase, cytochrome b556 subunit [Anaerolineales bacterium]
MAATTSRFSSFMEGVLYRGREGHWAYILHRVSGLAILLFVAIHVTDTSWVAYAPAAYAEAINLYGSLPFLISEYFLLAAIVYHAINGLNIIIKDTFPGWWDKHLQASSFWKVIALSALCWLPAAYFISLNIYNYYLCPVMGGAGACGGAEPPVPFAGLSITYLIVPAVSLVLVAVLASGGTFNAQLVAKAPRYVTVPGRNIETWSWLFMRWSGGILLVLIWIHVLANALLTGAHHIDLNYVAERWAQPLNWGATFTVLALAVLHGFNGLRAVLADYIHGAAANKAVTVGLIALWLVLTALGAYALLAGVRA